MYLKNVWKVVTAYLVGSFALIQFANIAFPYFEVQSYVGFTSDQIMKALFIGLPLGLPIVLITAHFLSKKGSFLNNELENIDTLQNIGSYKQKIAVIPFANLLPFWPALTRPSCETAFAIADAAVADTSGDSEIDADEFLIFCICLKYHLRIP